MESRQHHEEFAFSGRVDLDLHTQARQRLIRRRTRLLETARTPEQRRRLEQVEAALQWLDAGLYGRCSVCARELDGAQLEDDPADMTCLRCKRTARIACGRLAPGGRMDGDDVAHELAVHDEHIRPADFGIVSMTDDDELRQMQFEAAARAASHD